uniref:ERCC excision repair 1, endonuclease non-catalytic subunit n=1 Tax=Terrapene triunguis TaxID=2587831 RepID=A0A674JYQ1_9SAUR
MHQASSFYYTAHSGAPSRELALCLPQGPQETPCLLRGSLACLGSLQLIPRFVASRQVSVSLASMPVSRPARVTAASSECRVGAASGALPPGTETSTVPPAASGDSDPSPTLKPGPKSNCIIVSARQRGNPILKFVRNIPWEFGEIVPDYVLGQSTCALFLSLRYHNLNPNYIHERLQLLGKTYAVQVLLVQVDVRDPHQALKELAKMCILADCTLILAWR